MDFFEKLGNSLLKVGETAGINWANTVGNSSPAMATTSADDDTNGINISTTALVLTVGGVIGGLILVALLVK